eukprot:321889-Amphidinium_carterae.1
MNSVAVKATMKQQKISFEDDSVECVDVDQLQSDERRCLDKVPGCSPYLVETCLAKEWSPKSPSTIHEC